MGLVHSDGSVVLADVQAEVRHAAASASVVFLPLKVGCMDHQVGLAGSPSVAAWASVGENHGIDSAVASAAEGLARQVCQRQSHSSQGPASARADQGRGETLLQAAAVCHTSAAIVPVKIARCRCHVVPEKLVVVVVQMLVSHSGVCQPSESACVGLRFGWAQRCQSRASQIQSPLRAIAA